MLVDHLGIERLLAVSGGSMGGMQALEWAVAYPGPRGLRHPHRHHHTPQRPADRLQRGGPAGHHGVEPQLLPEENDRIEANRLDGNPLVSEGEVEPPLRVMALHALLYCERLFYLEEVEEIRVADAAVYAGRRLHVEVADPDDETPEQRSVEVSSDRWGLFGKVDAVRRRDGVWVAIEHKRGRCRRDDDGLPQAWPSDRIQAVAYAVLLEEALPSQFRRPASAITPTA